MHPGCRLKCNWCHLVSPATFVWECREAKAKCSIEDCQHKLMKFALDFSCTRFRGKGGGRLILIDLSSSAKPCHYPPHHRDCMTLRYCERKKIDSLLTGSNLDQVSMRMHPFNSLAFGECAHSYLSPSRKFHAPSAPSLLSLTYLILSQYSPVVQAIPSP